MRRIAPKHLVTLLLMSLVAASAVGCGHPARKPAGKMLVAASIAPLADFSRKVGGKLVEVKLLVPPGTNPHTYQIRPDEMEFLSNASVLVLNGIGLEFWADKAIDAAGNPKLIVVRAADGLKTIGSSEDAEHQLGNPHVWVDPVYAIRQVEAIRNAFIKADPAHKATYSANAEAYIKSLKQLDKDIRAEVRTFRSKEFVAFHPAWVYFAHEYGLHEAAVIQQSPGKEPTPLELENVIATVKKLKAKAIFAEPQYSPKAAEVVADETGAKVLFLDPLGQPPDYDYIATMRKNLRQMARALR